MHTYTVVCILKRRREFKPVALIAVGCCTFVVNATEWFAYNIWVYVEYMHVCQHEFDAGILHVTVHALSLLYSMWRFFVCVRVVVLWYGRN